jgi:outer membrane usher protein
MAIRPNCRRRLAHCLASALLLGAGAHDVAHAAGEAAAAEAPGDAAVEIIDDGGAASEGGDALYLDVELNGSPTRRIARFSQANGHLRTGSDTLRQLGFQLPADIAPVLALDELSGVSYRYDAPRQRIAITAPLDLLPRDTTRLNASAAAIVPAQASPGILLNYNLYGNRTQDDASGLSAYGELRSFGAWGVLDTTWVTRVADSPGSPPTADSHRLDTTWTRSFAGSATVLRLGDAITGSLPWSRATRLGGVQFQRDFALQPERITFPVPAFLGQAALPSTIDLYVNGLRQYSGDAPAGPFQLDSVPIVNGAGEAQVVVTDIMGRQSTYSFPFYTTSQLLQPGLSDWSVEAGFVREDYGTKSFSYDAQPVASGVWRRGMSDRITLEAHGEAGDGLALAGAGGVLQLGQAGLLTGSVSHSQWHGSSGSQASLGYAWRNPWFNLSLDSTRTRGDYRDIASLTGLPPAQRSERALVGFTYAPLGSIGATYVRLDYPGEDRSRFASAFWSRQFGQRYSLGASVNQNLDDHDDRSAFLSLTVSFGDRLMAGASLQHDRNGNVAALEASRSMDGDGGFGWRARVQDGSGLRGGQAELGWRGERGQALAGVQSLDGDGAAYAGFDGALVWMDGHTYATRRVDDAFAVVATGVPGVPVKLSNREIGRTDADGNLLVTPLNAWQRNQLAIDPLQLPADTRIDRVEGEVVPYDRSGVLVDFRVKPVQAATVVLVDGAGQPLPTGTVVERDGATGPDARALVGYDVIIYLEGLGGRTLLRAHVAGGICEVSFEYQAAQGALPQIGPLACRTEEGP